MLNRTNRTLSANTNRLDLGTRKLALNASGNNGNSTLRTAPQSLTDAVRAGFVEHPGIKVEGSPNLAIAKPKKPSMPSMSGSSPRLASPARDRRAGDQGPSAMSPQPASTAVVLTDDAATGGGVMPQVLSSSRPPRPGLGWRLDRAGRAGRSARAALALVTGVAPAR